MMRVNLAKGRRNSLEFNKSYLIMLLVFVFLISFISSNYFNLKAKVNDVEKEINTTDQKLEVLEDKRKEYLNLENEISKIEDKLKKKEKEAPQFADLNTQNWNIALIELAEQIPDKVMINSLDINEDGISIRGYAENSKLVSNFYDNLLDSNLIVNISLEQMNNGEDVNYLINGKIRSKEEEQ
ncbi:MAG: PilN domain-containing protein [Candidatus Woesearchaeota archaeon]